MTDSGRAGTPQNPRRAAAHQSPAPALEVVLRHRRCGSARGAVVTRGMAPRPEGVNCFAGAQVSSWEILLQKSWRAVRSIGAQSTLQIRFLAAQKSETEFPGIQVDGVEIISDYGRSRVENAG